MLMKKSEIPCKPDCPNRTWDCHSKCMDYAVYKALADEERVQIGKKRKESFLLHQDEVRRYNRNKFK
jgi:hypothetical protein